MPYPHGRACRCPQLVPDAGLLAYTVDCDHYDQLAAALSRMQSRPVAVAEPVDAGPACDGSYCCGCGQCERDRAKRRRAKVDSPRQPWEVRKAA